MQKTYLGQTAGGIIKTAKAEKMNAGNWEIVVRTADGENHQAIAGNGVLTLMQVQGVVVQMSMSDRAAEKMQKLQEEIEAKYAEENSMDSAQVVITVPRAKKGAWVADSRAQGRKLTDWLIERVDAPSEASAPCAPAQPDAPRNQEQERKMYAVTNAYNIRESIKAAGGVWDGQRKAWIITQSLLDKFNARTQVFGMAWCKGWAKAKVEAIKA